jgi:hypothetical protein
MPDRAMLIFLAVYVALFVALFVFDPLGGAIILALSLGYIVGPILWEMVCRR